jgi:hypothetical protein
MVCSCDDITPDTVGTAIEGVVVVEVWAGEVAVGEVGDDGTGVFWTGTTTMGVVGFDWEVGPLPVCAPEPPTTTFP